MFMFIPIPLNRFPENSGRVQSCAISGKCSETPNQKSCISCISCISMFNRESLVLLLVIR